MVQWITNCSIEKVSNLKFKYRYFLNYSFGKAHHVSAYVRIIQINNNGFQEILIPWVEDKHNLVGFGWHEGTFNFEGDYVVGWEEENCHTVQLAVKAYDSGGIMKGNCISELNLNPEWCVVLPFDEEEPEEEPEEPIIISPKLISTIPAKDLPIYEQPIYNIPLPPEPDITMDTESKPWWILVVAGLVAVGGYAYSKRRKK